ncbi:hypothetical protein LX32DRAFT_664994 [Colletotrichum zoysiae]|uniref:Uncharacterized protein n=1 Tax=Colletotrichum zoysiae TaxID=1216348 RepID=A0AAD9HDP8_9PEZI|nr:hypothetical protein LX32DRAFT_664994 [Colletotrichum zoysiae]
MNGKNLVEYDDPDAESTEAPFACCKLIEIKGGAPFSISILLGRGIGNMLTTDNSALIFIVHLGSQELMKRLVTKKTLGSEKARQHHLLLEGVYEEVGKSKQVLKKFKFVNGDNNGNIPKGSIKVDFYIVELLSKPERGQLVDTASSGLPPQAIVPGCFQMLMNNSFEPEVTNKSQASDTYDVKRLNHGHPIASFIFKYQTKATKLFDGLTLVDSEEDKAEINRLYLPLRPKGFLADLEDNNDHTEDDEAISIQSVHDTNSAVCKKRKAVSAFGESSPPRPIKVIALEE